MCRHYQGGVKFPTNGKWRNATTRRQSKFYQKKIWSGIFENSG